MAESWTVAVQVAQSLQRSRAAEANGSEVGLQVRPPAAAIWNGLECKLSTQTSKVRAGTGRMRKAASPAARASGFTPSMQGHAWHVRTYHAQCAGFH